MALTYNILDDADEKLNLILHYRLTTYSRSNAAAFMKEFLDKVEILLRYPGSGRQARTNSPDRPKRYIVSAKSQRLYYTHDENNLFIFDFVPTMAGTNHHED